MKKNTLSLLLLLTMLVSASGCSLYRNFPKAEGPGTCSAGGTEYKCTGYASMSPEEITANLSLEQKAAQMVMPAVFNVEPYQMKDSDYGSILSRVRTIDAASWRSLVDKYQNAALLSDAGIP